MTTEVQRLANRRNASKSTGPRTANGKDRSSKNALKHGLTAKGVILPGEDRNELAALIDQMKEEFCPQGPAQIELITRATFLMWRLRRVPMFEAALFDWTSRTSNISRPNQNSLETELHDKSDDTGLVIRNILCNDLLNKLNRYELALAKQLRFVMGHFEVMRRNEKINFIASLATHDAESTRKAHGITRSQMRKVD
jgi:hypothetical protein